MRRYGVTGSKDWSAGHGDCCCTDPLERLNERLIFLGAPMIRSASVLINACGILTCPFFLDHLSTLYSDSHPLVSFSCFVHADYMFFVIMLTTSASILRTPPIILRFGLVIRTSRGWEEKAAKLQILLGKIPVVIRT